MRTALLALPVAVLVSDQVFTLHRVPAYTCDGMYGLEVGDVVLISRRRRFMLGDMVAVPNPSEGRFAPVLLRRLSYLEGTVVPRLDNSGFIKVPKAHVFVTNDAAISSADSYHFGPVPWNMLLGKAVFIVFPFSRFGAIPPPPAAIVSDEQEDLLLPSAPSHRVVEM
jgi:hypothetical protein